MDNWDDLRFVVALARYGSMSQAAKHLHTNTATVSRRIRRINDTAPTTLFVKGRNDWELTSEGRQVFDIAARFSDDLNAFENNARANDITIRVIRVTALDFLVNEVLCPALPDFLENHPGLELELSTSDNKVSLAYGEADLALRLTRPTEGRLVAKRIAELPMGVWAASRKTTDWIGLPTDLEWTPEMKNGHAVFGKAPVLRLPSFQAILEAMETTGLAGIAPALMAERRKELQLLQPRSNMRIREVWTVFHETRKNDSAIKETSRWLEESFFNAG